MRLAASSRGCLRLLRAWGWLSAPPGAWQRAAASRLLLAALPCTVWRADTRHRRPSALQVEQTIDVLYQMENKTAALASTADTLAANPQGARQCYLPRAQLGVSGAGPGKPGEHAWSRAMGSQPLSLAGGGGPAIHRSVGCSCISQPHAVVDSALKQIGVSNSTAVAELLGKVRGVLDPEQRQTTSRRQCLKKKQKRKK